MRSVSRKKTTDASWSKETTRPTPRNVWKAPALIGLEEGTSSKDESNYDNEENLLKETTHEVRSLITELENVNNGETT